ncbi:MAG: LolA family protein [Alphaproteobacteria bacterium]
MADFFTRFRSIVPGLLLLSSALLTAREAVSAPKLSPEDQTTVRTVETYLNEVQTMKARFVQVTAEGNSVDGILYLSRPGRMRLEYAPPSPILVVADGTFLIYYDQKLGQTSYLGLDSTPAGILLKPNVKFGDETTVTGVRHLPGAVEVSLVQTNDPSAGELTLVLSGSPLALKQWRVKDAQNQVVTVSLFEEKSGVVLDPELFRFHDPNFFKPKGD